MSARLSMDVGEKLLRQFECVVCMEIMCENTVLCVTGHTICETCSRIIVECPLCNKLLTRTRNINLERIIKHYLDDPAKFYMDFKSAGSELKAKIETPSCETPKRGRGRPRKTPRRTK